MATAGDGMAPSESAGAGEKLHNSTGMSSDQVESTANISATTGISELAVHTFTRSKLQHPAATMEDLPDELLINIFIRLFAKQFGQMRSVSKLWNALLSHPSFVKSHLHHSIHNNNQQILLVFPGYNRPFTEYSSQSLHLEPTNYIKRTLIDVHLPVRVIGSVNGLICFSKTSDFDIHIWNPSLSAVSAIPPPRLMLTSPKYELEIGFGFDPKTDDYKLVKISGVRDSKYNVKEWLPVEVYSMRKRSWEFVTQPFPSHIKRINSPGYLCVDGHDGYLHWHTKPVVGTEERKILAFDMCSETFREIPLPHSILYSHLSLHYLGVLGGKLCAMTWREDGACEVWVMEEYGVPESWAKRHVFSQFNNAVCLFGFTLRNELLLVDKDRRLVLYDPIENKTKKTRTNSSAIKIMEYVDSLVWV